MRDIEQVSVPQFDRQTEGRKDVIRCKKLVFSVIVYLNVLLLLLSSSLCMCHSAYVEVKCQFWGALFSSSTLLRQGLSCFCQAVYSMLSGP